MKPAGTTIVVAVAVVGGDDALVGMKVSAFSAPGSQRTDQES